MTPIGELRLAIPVGLTQFGLPIVLVYITAVIGNMIPPLLILYGLPRVAAYARTHSKHLDHFFTWLFARTRKKTEKHMQKYGPLGLMLFVAIPLPNTGAWTGSLAAWLFGVQKKTALIYTLFGVMIAGIIVTLLTLGAQNIL